MLAGPGWGGAWGGREYRLQPTNFLASSLRQGKQTGPCVYRARDRGLLLLRLGVQAQQRGPWLGRVINLPPRRTPYTHTQAGLKRCPTCTERPAWPSWRPAHMPGTVAAPHSATNTCLSAPSPYLGLVSSLYSLVVISIIQWHIIYVFICIYTHANYYITLLKLFYICVYLCIVYTYIKITTNAMFYIQ